MAAWQAWTPEVATQLEKFPVQLRPQEPQFGFALSCVVQPFSGAVHAPQPASHVGTHRLAAPFTMQLVAEEWRGLPAPNTHCLPQAPQLAVP
jgi:hypothetical protein